MLRRVAALLMVLLFAGQALAGGIAYGIEAISNGFDNTSKCDDMACCALGKSPTGSMVAMICCEIKCGESTSGAQFNFAPQTLTLAPPLVVIRVVSLVAVSELETSPDAVSIRAAETHLLHHDPPDLFLSHSTFLI